ncbi:MAG: hypothetical protein J0H74_05020 [Chitinophagaceae bacterium]|nr:hypothetical protein [Chitinophagaceae bacterium]
MRHSRTFILLIILSVCSAGEGVRAQFSYNGTVTATAVIQSVMVLSVTNNSSTTVTFSSPAQYASAYKIANFNTIALKSNVNWSLSISAATSFFSNSGVYSSSNMPASVLRYNINGKSTLVTLSTTAQQLASGNNGDATRSGNTFNVDLTANPGYNYGPGIYTISTIYTLSAN